MMYLLFRYHNIDPRDYIEMGTNTKKIFRAFMIQEIEDRNKQYSDWED